jgi:hypothetical protein
MERLTEWNGGQTRHAYYPRCFKEPCYGGGCKIKDCPFETAVCERLAAYEDTGLTPKEVTALGELFDYALKESKTLAEQLTLLHHIRELAEADKDGRALILPCKVGTKVYRIRYEIADYPDEPDLEIADTWFTPEYRDDIGKTVFLTRAEAERALKEME